MGNLTLWFNLATRQFAQGPNSVASYFPPLNAFQQGQYQIAIYLVQPNGQVFSPWLYVDPTDLGITAAQVSFGNRFSSALYAITYTYTVEQDESGHYYLLFNLLLQGTALTGDLNGFNSISANFQFQYTTDSSQIIGQIVSVIRRAVGSGLNTAYIPALVTITTLTGGAPGGLNGIPTAGATVPVSTVIELVGVVIPDQASQYQLQNFVGSENVPAVVLPLDYDPVNNPVAWIQIL